jgi:molecular chaperone GrpE
MSIEESNATGSEQPVSESPTSMESEQNNQANQKFQLDESVVEDQVLETEEVSDSQEVNISLQQELDEWKDKYLRLASEFDNFRKRTLKEKSELVKYANEDLIKSILPVLDDFERSLLVIEKSDNLSAIQEGVKLIHHKFKNTLSSKGLKPMESLNQAFDSEHHEAITSIPAPQEDLKGKIIDEVEKGYYLDEKVIRFAKVIVGA